LLIDESHFESNIMVSLTGMLVMYTLYQSISLTLPPTAYFKLLDYWLIFSLLMPFFIFMIEVFWELELRNKVKTCDQPQKGWMASNTKTTTKLKPLNRKIPQVIVLVVTVLFILFYILYTIRVYNL
jgi:hypothetical protein